MANASGRFYGWVMGSSLPTALAADWLVSAWDQNAGMRTRRRAWSPSRRSRPLWLLLAARVALRLRPSASSTGATMANFTAPGRGAGQRAPAGGVGRRGRGTLRRSAGAGAVGGRGCTRRWSWLCGTWAWGSAGAGRGRRPGAAGRRRLCGTGSLRPRVRRSSACRRATSIPAPSTPSPARWRSPTRPAPGCTWTAPSGSGRRSSPDLAGLTAGMAEADSWATDAHKTLNTPYDGGIAIVRDPERCAARWACTPATC